MWRNGAYGHKSVAGREDPLPPGGHYVKSAVPQQNQRLTRNGPGRSDKAWERLCLLSMTWVQLGTLASVPMPVAGQARVPRARFDKRHALRGRVIDDAATLIANPD